MLELRDGILYRKRVVGEYTTYKLDHPKDLRPIVMEQLHDNMGHLGVEKTLILLKLKFVLFFFHRCGGEDQRHVIGVCAERLHLKEQHH